jgi:hypothetical protein
MGMNPAEWCGTTHRRQDIRPRRGSRRESSLHLEGSRGDQRLVRVFHGATSTTVSGAASPPEEVCHCMVLQRRVGAGRDAVPTPWREGPAVVDCAGPIPWTVLQSHFDALYAPDSGGLLVNDGKRGRTSNSYHLTTRTIQFDTVERSDTCIILLIPV